jgi:hypothetical protein
MALQDSLAEFVRLVKEIPPAASPQPFDWPALLKLCCWICDLSQQIHFAMSALRRHDQMPCDVAAKEMTIFVKLAQPLQAKAQSAEPEVARQMMGYIGNVANRAELLRKMGERRKSLEESFSFLPPNKAGLASA